MSFCILARPDKIRVDSKLWKKKVKKWDKFIYNRRLEKSIMFYQFILKHIWIGGYKKNYSIVSNYFGNKFLRDTFVKVYLLEHIFMYLYMQTCLISHLKIREESGKILIKIRLFFRLYYILTVKKAGNGFDNIPKKLRKKMVRLTQRFCVLHNKNVQRMRFKTKRLFLELNALHWIRNYWEFRYNKNTIHLYSIWLNFEPFEYLVGVLLFDLKVFYGDKVKLMVEPLRNDQVDGNMMSLYILAKIKQGYSIRSTIKYFSRELKRLYKMRLLRGWKFVFKGRFRKRPRKKITRFKFGVFSERNSFKKRDYADAGFGYTKLKYSAIGLKFCFRRRVKRRALTMWRFYRFE